MNAILERKADVFFILGALLLSACGGGGGPTPEAVDIPVVVDELSVIAEGRLVPVESVQLGFRIGGEIAEVLVAEGDTVEAGQLLARLGNGQQLEAAVASALLELVRAQQALDTLYADAPLALAQAQLELANTRDALRDAERKWQYQQEGQRGSSTTVRAAKAELVLAKDAKERAERDANKFSSDDSEHAQDYKNYAAAVQRYRLALSSLNWYTGHPTDIQQGLLDGQVAIAKAHQDQAELEWEKWRDGPDLDALILAEAGLVNAEAQLEAAKADLEIRAPIAGTVSTVAGKAGEITSPGQVRVVLADFASWMVETDNLTEIELPSIAVGKPVLVTFDALRDVEMAGVVTTISPYFEIKRGDITYAVEIGLNETDPRLMWGMTTVVTFEESRPLSASR